MGEQGRRERKDAESVSMMVVSEVAEREALDPTELPPLQNVVDSDALNALFSNDKDGTIQMNFEYISHSVQINGGIEPQVRVDWPLGNEGVCWISKLWTYHFYARKYIS